MSADHLQWEFRADGAQGQDGGRSQEPLTLTRGGETVSHRGAASPTGHSVTVRGCCSLFHACALWPPFMATAVARRVHNERKPFAAPHGPSGPSCRDLFGVSIAPCLPLLPAHVHAGAPRSPEARVVAGTREQSGNCPAPRAADCPSGRGGTSNWVTCRKRAQAEEGAKCVSQGPGWVQRPRPLSVFPLLQPARMATLTLPRPHVPFPTPEAPGLVFQSPTPPNTRRVLVEGGEAV